MYTLRVSVLFVVVALTCAKKIAVDRTANAQEVASNKMVEDVLKRAKNALLHHEHLESTILGKPAYLGRSKAYQDRKSCIGNQFPNSAVGFSFKGNQSMATLVSFDLDNTALGEARHLSVPLRTGLHRPILCLLPSFTSGAVQRSIATAAATRGTRNSKTDSAPVAPTGTVKTRVAAAAKAKGKRKTKVDPLPVNIATDLDAAPTKLTPTGTVKTSAAAKAKAKAKSKPKADPSLVDFTTDLDAEPTNGGPKGTLKTRVATAAKAKGKRKANTDPSDPNIAADLDALPLTVAESGPEHSSLPQPPSVPHWASHVENGPWSSDMEVPSSEVQAEPIPFEAKTPVAHAALYEHFDPTNGPQVITKGGYKIPRLMYAIQSMVDVEESGDLVPRDHVQIREQKIEELVETAVREGFMGIVDTSEEPQNYAEPQIGEGLQRLFATGVERESLFIQARVNPIYDLDRSHGVPIWRQVEVSIQKTLRNLGLEYVDCLVLRAHTDMWTNDHDQTMEAWRAMEDAFRKGLVRVLGISDVYTLPGLRRLLKDAVIQPTVVQQSIVTSEFLTNEEFRELYSEAGLYFQCFWPFYGEGKKLKQALQDISDKIGERYEVIWFRWLMGLRIIPITACREPPGMSLFSKVWKVPLTKEDAHTIDQCLADDVDGFSNPGM